MAGRLELGNTMFWLGEFSVSRRHFDECLGLYDVRRDAVLAVRRGWDPKVTALCYLSFGLEALGTSGNGFSFRWIPTWGAPSFNGGTGPFHS